MIILLLTVFFFFHQADAQVKLKIHWQYRKTSNSSDTIYYNPRQKLSWENFRGRPSENDAAVAITHSGFGYDAGYESDGVNNELNITLYCYFNKRSSWVKVEGRTSYILLHEQHHFDITYLGAKKFFSALKKTVFDPVDYSRQLEVLYNQSFTEMNKLQEEYDDSTENGQLKGKQKEWNARIDGWMRSL